MTCYLSLLRIPLALGVVLTVFAAAPLLLPRSVYAQGSEVEIAAEPVAKTFHALDLAQLDLQEQAGQVGFGSSGLSGASVANPTSLQFGPDGRLYVGQQGGFIKAFGVQRNGPNDYDVTSTETIGLVKGLPNYEDDDGSLCTVSSCSNKRQITGLLVAGTATNPILYVTSSDPRIGAGGGGNDTNLDTNSGLVSKLTCAGGIGESGPCQGWDMVHLVRGLPRSEENHASNGMQLSPDGNTLYLAQGGHTNAGSPSNNFAFTTEYALAAALLKIDLVALEAMTTKTDVEGQRYKYDLPTLDDPTRSNANGIDDPDVPGYDGVDVGDPFGGNDGLNQAKIVSGGPVQIYSPGYRNLYDIVLTEAGRMYGVDNGANGNWGGFPEYEESFDCTNDFLPGEPGSTKINNSHVGVGPDPATYPAGVTLLPGSDGRPDNQVNNQNGLHLIPEGYYAGHPTPVRGNPAGAGLYTAGSHSAGGAFWRSQVLDPSHPDFAAQSLPVDWPPVPASEANPIECDFQNSGEDDGAIANYGPSTNGIAEYTASNFESALQGDLLAAGFAGSAPVYHIKLNASGDAVVNCPDVPANCTTTLFDGFGAQPLDVIAQGDEGPFPGTVWAVTYGGTDAVTVFEPTDYDGGGTGQCDATDSDTIDEDGDGYTNADEIYNGTNPCSAGSKPNDHDGTLAADGFKDSDLHDPDDDDDGVDDPDDAFALDAANGTATGLPIQYEFFNNTPGVTVSFFGLGFTGLMTNGSTDYLDQFIPPEEVDGVIAGGTAGILTIPKVTTGDAYQGNNTQENAFQFGLGVDAATAPFTIYAQINGPAFFGGAPAAHQAQGIQIGAGNMDNYLKLVLSAAQGFEVLVENGGVASSAAYEPFGGSQLSANAIGLYLSVDPVAGTVQPKVALDDGSVTSLGPALTLGGEILDAVQGTYEVAPGVPSALAVGVIATSFDNQPEFSATWDFIRITENPVTATGEWKLIAPFDETRHENAFVQAGDKFYLLGGRESQVVKIYDPATEMWSDGASLPSGAGWSGKLHHFQAVELDGLIYAIGAMTGNCCEEPSAERVYLYDPVADVWILGPEIPAPRRRGGGGAIVRDGKIYLASGNTNGHTGPVSAHFDVFDPATVTWTPLPDVPNPRDHFFATYVEDQDKLYLIGGRTSGDPDTFLGTVPEVDVYDFASESWSTLPAAKNVPTQRASAPTGLVGNEIVVAGGEREQGPAKDVTEAFNVDTETWRTLAPMQTQRHATQAIVSNAGLYVAGGSPKRGGPGGTSPDLEAFYLFGETSPTGAALSASTLGAPSSIDFGQVTPGASAGKAVALSGTGGSQAVVIETVSLSGSGDFSLTQPFSGPLVIAPDATLHLDVVFAPADEGTETGVLTVTYGGGMTADVALSGEGGQGGGPAVALFRVNAGGPQLAATDSGPDWMADADASAFRTNGSRANGHGPPNATDVSVPPGTPASLFETERWDPPKAPEMQWNFPVDNGAYLVRLYLMDGFQGTDEAGQRVFDIAIEGTIAADDLDLAGQYGHKTAVALEVAATVSDGSLTIGFAHEVQNPLVNAIEILSFGGGPANEPPQISAIGDQTSAEGDDVADAGLAVQASDPDNGPQSLHYSATGLPEGVELEPTNGQFFGTIANGAAAGSPYNVTVTVSDGAASADVAFTWTVTGFTTLGEALYRVNTGGPLLAAADGSQPAWGRDQGNAANKSPHLVEGGNKNKRTSDAITLDASVPASAPMALFQTERWDPPKGAEMRWAFSVAAGTPVEIRLYLAETFLTETGTNSNASKGPRVMDVAVDGAVPAVFSDLDVFADAGHDVGVMRSFTTTSDGTIDIAFVHVQQNPSIKAIEIVEAGGTAGNASPGGSTGGPTSGSDAGATERSAGQAAYLPEAFKLRGNYPNPFNPSTEISLDVPERAQVRVEVYNMLGQRILTVPEQDVAPGAGQTLRIEAASLVSGVYVYRVVAKMGSREVVGAGRMTLLK